MKDLNRIISQFKLPSKVVAVDVISNGFINSTFKISCEDSSYILQKININVFPDVDNLMHNILLVTRHVVQKTGKGMCVIPTINDELYYRFENDFYRMYNFVENSVAYNKVENAQMFYLAGVGFGKFQNDLEDFDAKQLHDVIADFHNTENRLRNFRDAVEKDAVGRNSSALSEIRFLEDNAKVASIICQKLASGELQYRVTHNDTKLNNILFDKDSGEPICAIDLDTVMKGSVLYDVGDAIRYGANPAGESGTEAEVVELDVELYKAFVSGFLSETHTVLTKKEIELIPESVLVMTYELALRFLEDYLRGDIYFGEATKGINFQRAKVQIELFCDIEKKIPLLREITYDCVNKLRG